METLFNSRSSSRLSQLICYNGSANKEVDISIRAVDQHIEFIFKGTCSDVEEYRSKEDLIKSRANIGLLIAEDTINRFVANHKGTYYRRIIEAGSIKFRFVIPVEGPSTPHIGQALYRLMSNVSALSLRANPEWQAKLSDLGDRILKEIFWGIRTSGKV